MSGFKPGCGVFSRYLEGVDRFGSPCGIVYIGGEEVEILRMF